MLLMSAPEAPLSFWGEIFPAYLGAVGGIASAGVAVAAFIQSRRNKRSVNSVKVALESPDTSVPNGGAPEERQPTPSAEESDNGGIGPTVRYGYLAGPNPPASEPWSLLRETVVRSGRPDVAISNSSDRTLSLIGLELFDGSQWIASDPTIRDEVPPGGTRFFDFKTIGGREANINVVRVKWLEQDGSIHSQQILV